MSVTIDEHGWIQEAEHYPTVRTYRLQEGKPLGIVWHCTAIGPGLGYARSLAERIQTYDRHHDRPASWNVLIAWNGKIFQSASLLKGTWHAGVKAKIRGQVRRVNTNLTGVELENAGLLKRTPGGIFCEPFSKRKLIQPSERFVPIHGTYGWDAYSDSQVTAARELILAMKTRYGLDNDDCRYLHSDLDPKRRSDPGPVWEQHLAGILSSIPDSR